MTSKRHKVNMSGKVYPHVVGLSDETIAAVREAFSIFDRDGAGTILARELGTAMKSLGHDPTAAELTDMLNEVDFEGTGVVDFQEFQMLIAKRIKLQESAEELREAFKVFDRDRKGYITASDLRQVLFQACETATPEDLDEMIKEADFNKTGHIDYDEFINMMLHK